MNRAPSNALPAAARALPFVVGALALVPLVWCYRAWRDLWWFGDDWDLLDQMKRAGIWRWTIQPFAENFVPLFKMLWGHLVFATHGSYFAMIVVLWLTHALNAALLARWLLRAGFGWAGTLFASAIFALSAANAESLAWSVQWSAVLATTFFLLAAQWHDALAPAGATASRWRTPAILFLLCAASALSFSRGVLTGAVLATAALVPVGARPAWRTRLTTALACFLPALLVALVIARTSPGQAAQWREHGRAMAEFGVWYWAATPLHSLLSLDSWGWRTTALLFAIKLTLVIWALTRTRGSQRQLLVVVLLLDLGNAALLGIGRHHTGLGAVTSSRYHYLGLLCTLPFVSVAFDALLARVKFRPVVLALGLGVAAVASVCVARAWPHEAELFATHRGRNTRQILLRDPNPPALGAVPGIPFLPTARAQELIKRYQLH